jgi:hypothetical protein
MNRPAGERELGNNVYNLDLMLVGSDIEFCDELLKPRKQNAKFFAKKFFEGKDKNYMRRNSNTFTLFPGSEPGEECLNVQLSLDELSDFYARENISTLSRLEYIWRWNEKIENHETLHLYFKDLNDSFYRVFIIPKEYMGILKRS